jgi:hypothetical protein
VNDFAGDEAVGALGRFVIGENAGAGVHVVGFAVIGDGPEGGTFGDGVRAARAEGGILGGSFWAFG